MVLNKLPPRIIHSHPRAQAAHDEWRASLAMKIGRRRMLKELNAKRAVYTAEQTAKILSEQAFIPQVEMPRFQIPKRLIMPTKNLQMMHDLWRRDMINRMDPDKWKYAYRHYTSIPISRYSSWALRNAISVAPRRDGLELPASTPQAAIDRELVIRGEMIKKDPELEFIYGI